MNEVPTARQLADALDEKRQGSRYMARCPAHDDSTPSLSIGEKDSATVFHCHAGCGQDDVLAALRRKGVWPEKQEPSGLTLQEYATAKGLDFAFLRSVGLSDYTHQYYGPVVRIPYLAADGRELSTRYRLRLEKSSGGDDRFRWAKGSKVLPYGLNRLPANAEERDSIALVEGESDCHTLWQAELPALGIPGASTWRESWADYLDGYERIYIVVEPDRGGETVKTWVAESSIRERVCFVELGDYGDVSALYLSDPENFADNWTAATDAARPWSDLEERRHDRAAAEAYEQARELLHAPDLLDRIGETMRRVYVGDLRPAKLVYVAMTSRLLERPLCLALIAQSASGKSYTVETVLELMPPESYYHMLAGSSRALVYTEEEFEHRVVIVGEIDSIPEDGPPASAVRSIAADNRMAYDVVERDEESGKWGVRHIEKRGPTGMITTGTHSLREQMSTRMLEVAIPDDEAHTREILTAHAQSVTGAAGKGDDPSDLIALQRWLALEGNHKVIIPFAGELAASLPDGATKTVRMRRDFRQLLTCIQAVALLYQAQRQKTAAGEIVATIDDYALARDLLEDVFGAITSEGVTPAIRETVEAIEEDEEVSQAELARRLDLAKSTVHWRVKKALAGGWIVNLEEQRGKAYRLARGAPLPEDVPVLPEPDAVREAFEHSNTHSNSDLLEVEGQLFERSNENREDGKEMGNGGEGMGISPSSRNRFEHSNTPPDLLEVEDRSNGRSSVRTGTVFSPAEVEQLAGPADDDGRRYIKGAHDLSFDSDGRLWDGEQEPLQGTIRWVREQLDETRA